MTYIRVLFLLYLGVLIPLIPGFALIKDGAVRAKRNPDNPAGQAMEYMKKGVGIEEQQQHGVKVFGQEISGGVNMKGGFGKAANGDGGGRMKRDFPDLLNDGALNTAGILKEKIDEGIGYQGSDSRKVKFFGQEVGVDLNMTLGYGDAIRKPSEDDEKRRRRDIYDRSVRSKRSPCGKKRKGPVSTTPNPDAEAVRRRRQAKDEVSTEDAINEKAGFFKKAAKVFNDMFDSIADMFSTLKRKIIEKKEEMAGNSKN